jgi:acetyltransferase-like isoleucine patch superfamily enzyme
MPLRKFRIGEAGEELYPQLVSSLAEKLDSSALDRNVVVRDALAQIYLGRAVDHDEALRDPALPLGARALVASMDPRNGTLEAEYYKELDLEKWARVKPLLWFWQMFDHSPVGRNVRLGVPMRAMLAKRVFQRCGEDVRIFHDVEFSFGYNLSVGNGVTIHRNVLIDDRGEVVIGNEASISDYANIYSHSHAVEDIHDVTLARTVIGDRVRITYHAVVLSGVTVEADALVGSVAVVSKPVGPGVIAAGIPAKPIGQKKTVGPK